MDDAPILWPVPRCCAYLVGSFAAFGGSCDYSTVLATTVGSALTNISPLLDFSAIPITIGFRQSLYYVNENAGSVVVCYAVLSGRTATRSIDMQLRTVKGDAKGV